MRINNYDHPKDYFIPNFNGEDFTEEWWMYLYTIPGHAIGIMSQEKVYELNLEGVASYQIYFKHWYEGTEDNRITTETFPLNIWSHWTVVYDGSTYETKVYKDAVEVYSQVHQLQFYPGTKSFVNHEGSSTGVCGDIVFSTYRYWSTKFDATYLLSIKDE